MKLDIYKRYAHLETESVRRKAFCSQDRVAFLKHTHFLIEVNMESNEEPDLKRRKTETEVCPPLPFQPSLSGNGDAAEEDDCGQFEPDEEDMIEANVNCMAQTPVREWLEMDPLQVRDNAYTIIDPKDIYTQMKNVVDESFSIIQTVPHSTLRTMLNHVNWDKDKLIANYYDDYETFMMNAKIHAKTENSLDSKIESPSWDCLICYDTTTEETSFAMSCGHRVCNPCWTDYLTSKIMEHGDSQYIPCPGCSIIVEDRTVETLITDKAVLEKYMLLISNNFVTSNKRMRWCPRVSCMDSIYS